MKIGKELDMLHESTEKLYKRTLMLIRERYTFSKTTEKHLETVLSYLITYELMQRELNRIRDFCSVAKEAEELSTIEDSAKELYDNFWK